MKQQVEEERERQIRESKDPTSALNTERNKTYDRLVMVQEHLLHHVRGLKVRERGEMCILVPKNALHIFCISIILGTNC